MNAPPPMDRTAGARGQPGGEGMSSYCNFAPGHPVHDSYHGTEYGFPQRDEAVLFERLCLEIMQAGLSWELILKRREGMRRAFADFVVDHVAAMGPDDEARLLA